MLFYLKGMFVNGGRCKYTHVLANTKLETAETMDSSFGGRLWKNAGFNLNPGFTALKLHALRESL